MHIVNIRYFTKEDFMYSLMQPFDPATFSLRLTQLRQLRNISARSMSLELGHNKNYIAQIESQKFLPSLLEFFEICHFLEISPNQFFDLDVKTPNEYSEITDLCRRLTPGQADCVYNMLKEFTSPS